MGKISNSKAACLHQIVVNNTNPPTILNHRQDPLLLKGTIKWETFHHHLWVVEWGWKREVEVVAAPADFK
jgi:hypothetical protein